MMYLTDRRDGKARQKTEASELPNPSASLVYRALGQGQTLRQVTQTVTEVRGEPIRDYKTGLLIAAPVIEAPKPLKLDRFGCGNPEIAALSHRYLLIGGNNPATLKDATYRRRYRLFLERLKQARVEAGLTQSEVARHLGRPQSFVSKAESGERRLDLIEVDELAKLYAGGDGRLPAGALLRSPPMGTPWV